MKQSQSQRKSGNVQSMPLRYRPDASSSADVFNDNGEVQPHWRYLLDGIETLGHSVFADRQEKAMRILRNDGATYNIYSDENSPNHTWGLDLVPALISSDEWASIEAGLLERSELFNLIYKDIYGPRDLIRTGVLPPEALFSHRGFLRACQGLSLLGEHDLIVHGVDMMRDENGEMCVMTDRTQCPSGMGFALENRTVMSRVLPSLFRDSQVHRLAVFFQRLRSKLNTLSPNTDQPRIVVLTPGAHNETYFEHAYMANYLGFDLVQSGDLVVRNGFVWMRSLEGLSQVDVILRRVDDWYCDPVELRSDSQLGVANLLEVARAGNVVIANPLGSGVLENPVFLKYLPDIAKALLGRELRLPSVNTYWAGEKNDYQYIADNFDKLVIKPIFRGNGAKSVHGGELSKAKRKDMLAVIKQKPNHYVAQPVLTPHNLPSYVDGELQPRPSILRTFAVACDTSYALMPGGLTRVGIDKDSFAISNQAGSLSKDTWVIASEPERKVSMEESTDAGPSRDESLISLPSRVVENLFWMGRYAERAEASLRLLRTVFVMLNGEDSISDTCRRILLSTITKQTGSRPGFIDASDELLAKPETELKRVVTDAGCAGSVKANLNALLYCADQSKELLSSDTLRVINDIRDALNQLDSVLKLDDNSAPEEALDPLVTGLMALAGLAHESMVRGVGWRFMQMGRRLERGVQTTLLIKEVLVPEVPPEDQQSLIEAMLLSMETLISYRRRYRARLGVQTSLDLVLLDTSNPRSLLYQIDATSDHIHRLPKAPDGRHELDISERAVLEAQTLLKLSVLTELSSREEGERKVLKQQLERVYSLLGTISTGISDKYFNHRETSRQLVRSNWDN